MTGEEAKEQVNAYTSPAVELAGTLRVGRGQAVEEVVEVLLLRGGLLHLLNDFGVGLGGEVVDDVAGDAPNEATYDGADEEWNNERFHGVLLG